MTTLHIYFQFPREIPGSCLQRCSPRDEVLGKPHLALRALHSVGICRRYRLRGAECCCQHGPWQPHDKLPVGRHLEQIFVSPLRLHTQVGACVSHRRSITASSTPSSRASLTSNSSTMSTWSSITSSVGMQRHRPRPGPPSFFYISAQFTFGCCATSVWETLLPRQRQTLPGMSSRSARPILSFKLAHCVFV